MRGPAPETPWQTGFCCVKMKWMAVSVIHGDYHTRTRWIQVKVNGIRPELVVPVVLLGRAWLHNNRVMKSCYLDIGSSLQFQNHKVCILHQTLAHSSHQGKIYTVRLLTQMSRLALYGVLRLAVYGNSVVLLWVSALMCGLYGWRGHGTLTGTAADTFIWVSYECTGNVCVRDHEPWPPHFPIDVTTVTEYDHMAYI